MQIKALKFKSISLVLVLLLLMVTGCDDKATKGDFIKENIIDNSKYRTVTICFPSTENSRSDFVLEEIESRLKSTLKIDLNFKWLGMNYGEDYIKRIEEMIASGQEIDAFYARNPSTYVLELYRKGLLKDISEDLRLYAPQIYSRMDNEMMNAASCEGSLIALPNFMPSTTRLELL